MITILNLVTIQNNCSIINYIPYESESEVAQSCLTLSDPMDYSPAGPPSMGFSRQEYWSGVPLPSPYDTAEAHKNNVIL